MRPLAVATVLLVAAGCGTPVAAGSPRHRDEPAAPPTASVGLTHHRCADVVVLGLRGQGQSARSHQGVGHEVQVVVRAMAHRLGGTSTVELRAVRYPAVPAATEAAYDADVATGVRMVGRRADSLGRRCPSTRVVLVAFSEGAQVAHLAAEHRRFVLVALMGDPLRNPRLTVETLSFGTRLAGRGNAGYGAGFADPARVVEACVAGDDVCNAPLTGRVGGVSATHREFYERPATARVVGAAAVRALS